MKAHRFIFIVMAIFCFGCEGHKQIPVTKLPQICICYSPLSTNSIPAPSSHPQTNSQLLPLPFRFPSADLATYGSPTTNSIRVAVFGMNRTVKRPGYYYLSSGAVVREAIEAAQGIDDFTSWTRRSGIIRQKADGQFEIIRYQHSRFDDEQIPLLDGDSLFFGRPLD